jgi:hypothetical protein
MRWLTLLGLLCFALPVSAQTLVHNANGTSAPLTITSTGSAHLIVVGFDAGTSPTSVTLTGGGNQSATQVCTIAGALCSIFSNSFSKLSYWIVASSNSGQTSVTQSGGASINAVYEYEYSGMITTNSVFDWMAFCTTGSGHPCTAYYTPSTANEAVVAILNCSGSAGASPLTGSTWLNQSNPSGEGGGQLITSSIALLTASTASSGCNSGTGMGGVIAGFRAAGATATTCSWTPAEGEVSTLATGTNPTASVSVTAHLTADLAVINGWCLNSCTPGSVTVGSETATEIGVAGNSSSTTGQPHVFYILSTTVTGAQTLSLPTSGGATQSQVAYYEYTPNPGCTVSHDTDASLGTGNTGGGTAVNTPSITTTAGDLEHNFTAVASHISTINSPWSCYAIINNGPAVDCTYITTINAGAYILSASGSATANNMTSINAGVDWQALITSFKLTGAAGGAKPSGHAINF